MLCQECLDVAHVHVQDSGAVSKTASKLSLQQSCRFLTVLRTAALGCPRHRQKAAGRVCWPFTGEKVRKGIELLMLEYSLSCRIAGFGHEAVALDFNS